MKIELAFNLMIMLDKETEENFQKQCLKLYVKHSDTVMIWGFSGVIATNRSYCANSLNGTTNSDAYTDSFESKLLPAVENYFVSNHSNF